MVKPIRTIIEMQSKEVFMRLELQSISLTDLYVSTGDLNSNLITHRISNFIKEIVRSHLNAFF